MRRISLILVPALLAGCAAASTAAPAATPAASPIASAPSVASPAASAPSASSVPTDQPTVTPTEAPVPTGPSIASAPIVQLGTGLSVSTTGGGKATVGVVDFRKETSCGAATPSAGDVFVTASVGYSADSGSVDISPTDWVVVNSQKRMAAATPTVTCEKGTYAKHTLAQGQDDGGWLTFEVAADAQQVDLVYFPAGGPKAVWHLW